MNAPVDKIAETTGNNNSTGYTTISLEDFPVLIFEYLS